MRAKTLLSAALGAVFLASSVFTPSPTVALDACDVRYSLTPLQITPPVPPDLVGITSFNNRGQVIGFYLVDLVGPTGRAFIWSLNDPVVRDLGDLGGPGAFPNDLNDRGTVVGASDVSSDVFHAFRWHGRMRDLGTLGGNFSVALGINNLGFIVGRAETAGEEEHGVLWSPLGRKARDLETLGGRDSQANAINNRGQIVGWSSTGVVEHAVLWAPLRQRIRDLGTLGGSNSAATAINDRGQVAGYSETIPGDACRHAFFWDGTMQDLGTLGGGKSEPSGINVWGQVVGSSQISSDPANPCDGPEHAFIWSKQCGMRDLNTLTSPPSTALSQVFINDLGQMVAGTFEQWYLLKPKLWPWSGADAQ